MKLNRWWADNPAQRFWMEGTNRPDIGVDLHAPQTRKGNKPYWGYSLVREVEEGDIVFHYSTERNRIESWSVAQGGHWEAETLWGARGTASRGEQPFKRPGYFRGLHGPFELPEPLHLDELRANVSTLRAAYSAVQSAYPKGNLYLPFQIRTDGVRGGQGYLFKMPAEVVDAFPKLSTAVQVLLRAQAKRPMAGLLPHSLEAAKIGRTYLRANEEAALSERDPFPVDPAVVERGIRGHAKTQNLLADVVQQHGHKPLSPANDDPAYDLLWHDGETLCVAEVKSLTVDNEERQLRLGLGQVLRYRQRLASFGTPVRAYLVAEREPSDPEWQSLCDSVGVTLAWPSVLAERLQK
ncbi:hypothetical protein [Myxococcus xanthus]|uniref:Uncharacterized protein n=1 Tax=Myxococcus xanthus TaxID=34 RepID=A0A7Y4IIC8_MYXXA|nr:hypothetical protein [Myxococcus xanthus]NOJ79838.1 hypothetical protein [Myxococcus xanthus]NOJ86844.1 hypothetical protein [Myxococcus xanthus]